MVELKAVTKILLMSHGPCGAAKVLGLDKAAVTNYLLWWAKKLRTLYPHIEIEIYTEQHSDCGTDHFGHDRVECDFQLVEAA